MPAFIVSAAVSDWVPPPPYPAANLSLVSSFAFLGDVNNLVRFAQLLNDSGSASHYSDMYGQLAQEFHSTFYSPANSCYGECEQTSNALALALPGVVPANLTDAVLSSLVTDIKAKGHFTCGIIGISQLFPVLSSHGQHDLALSLATATTYPSYGWQFNNEFDNATTCWELWDSCLEGSEMNSKNHVSATPAAAHSCHSRLRLAVADSRVSPLLVFSFCR
jgi:alpha-L-rhamnosidase